MIHHGDCLDVMPTLGAVDAIVCDPPYGLSFMGKNWDHGVPGEPFWSTALGCAKPGAYLLAFGGTRTFHRLACAIEDAGWEMRDCLSWLYGSGFPKGKACLKPGWEPIILARKPGKSAHLQIDACRIEGAGAYTNHTRKVGTEPGWNGRHTGEVTFHSGRWPANVVLDEEAGAMLDAQSGEGKAGTAGRRSGINQIYGSYGPRTEPFGTYGDTGGASRFFYCAKASRREREAGLEGAAKQVASVWGGDEDDLTEGKKSTVPRSNHHPTVKPLSLMRWLCRLVTPPGGLILDPFCGSGTTGCAAALEGFRFVGIERESEYVAIAERRIAHWVATMQPDLLPAA